MMLGVKALNFSAAVAFEDQVDEEAKPQAALQAAAAGALMTTAHAIESPSSVARPEVVEKPSKYESSARRRPRPVRWRSRWSSTFCSLLRCRCC